MITFNFNFGDNQINNISLIETDIIQLTIRYYLDKNYISNPDMREFFNDLINEEIKSVFILTVAGNDAKNQFLKTIQPIYNNLNYIEIYKDEELVYKVSSDKILNINLDASIIEGVNLNLRIVEGV